MPEAHNHLVNNPVRAHRLRNQPEPHAGRVMGDEEVLVEPIELFVADAACYRWYLTATVPPFSAYPSSYIEIDRSGRKPTWLTYGSFTIVSIVFSTSLSTN